MRISKDIEKQFTVSIITKIEILGFHKLTIEDKILFEGFFKTIIIVPISNYIVEKAIDLRQQRRMALGDSLITATALTHIAINQKRNVVFQ